MNKDNLELVNKCKHLFHWIFQFMIIIIIAIIIRVFFLEIYQIPSSSMEPTLIPGDIIIVSKMSYGARILKLQKFFKKGIIDYKRTWGWSNIKKGDVFVFNWPNYRSLDDSNLNMYGNFIVKRCYGCPGDTIIIKKNELKNEERLCFTRKKENSIDLFPHDTSLHWTVANYGPLFVPGKDLTIYLSPLNASHYDDILKYEGQKVKIHNDSVFLNNKYCSHYTFKNNYYFMKGDNFFGSEDSRYWGLVPEGNIVGKSKLILLSLGSSEKGEKKIRWNRFFKFIK